jgi:hypothetical protein
LVAAVGEKMWIRNDQERRTRETMGMWSQQEKEQDRRPATDMGFTYVKQIINNDVWVRVGVVWVGEIHRGDGNTPEERGCAWCAR